jgi:uncharacterized protein (TIGR04255 family)
VDLRVELPEAVNIQTLEKIHDKIRDTYPISKKRVLFEGRMSAGDQVLASAKQTHLGFAFYSADNLHVFQARRDGFSFSRLAPYDTWENLRDEAKRHWSLYKRTVSPLHIDRIALRYINEISIPGPRIDFDDYFLTIPKIGSQLPQALSKFIMQLHVPQPDLDAHVILTQTMQTGPSPDGAISVILDIDTFIEQKQMSEPEAWAAIEALRVRKNDFFEGCITDRARELFY